MRVKDNSSMFRTRIAVLAILAFAETTVIAQAPSSKVRSGQIAASAASKPSTLTPAMGSDLQGIWSNAAVVPFQRAKDYGERQLMTEAEHQKALEAQLKLNDRPDLDNRAGRGTEKDVARAYNEHWSGDKPTIVSYRTSEIIDPPDGRLPAYTPEAQERIKKKAEYLKALLQGTSGGLPGPISPLRYQPPPDYNLDRMNRTDGPEDRSGGERCFLDHLPVVLGAAPLTAEGIPFGSIAGVVRIVQSAESIDFYYDVGQGSGFNRVVPITNRPHLPASVRQYWGDPIGRWEGDTFVIDVTNFSDETNFRGSRQNLHLIERYKRTGPKTLQITVTAEDPTTWVRPFTFVQELTKNADKPNMVYEGGCQEGNYALLDMLVNTRAAEKLFSAGKGPDPALEDNASGGHEDSPNNPFTAPVQ